MNDRELLEMAAKVAGMSKPSGIYSNGTYWWYNSTMDGEGRRWNPLKDDGDAFRLAASLGLVVSTDPRSISAQTIPGVTPSAYASQGGGDHLTDIRRAIVRAAAEMGEKS